MLRALIAFTALAASLVLGAASDALACERGEVFDCADEPVQTELVGGSVTASSMAGLPGTNGRVASNAELSERTYRLISPCALTDGSLGACEVGLVPCPVQPDRIIGRYYVLSQRIAQEDRRPIDGLAPDAATRTGQPFGPSTNEGLSCVDVTDLNPPPSPAEVFSYFQTLPLPQLTTQQQPPGAALVGLPVVFFTDSPTQQTFTVDIRGFQVAIVATAQTYTWHTGNGTDLTSTDPGAPYPDQTITHDYTSGTYTASVTVTWGATFSVDDGAQVTVPGTTTTDGPPVTFDVLEASAVLTNPSD